MADAMTASVVSIHAPRARGDPGRIPAVPVRRFNSRPSCEGRPGDGITPPCSVAFQFTPLVRGATRSAFHRIGSCAFQFTPLVRGATALPGTFSALLRFNSRPSCEGRPSGAPSFRRLHVSIHAPRARGDHERAANRQTTGVSIHAPRARGDHPFLRASGHCVFQFTPLVRGATSRSCRGTSYRRVSIHAPRARGDFFSGHMIIPTSFNSRPSCEGRHAGLVVRRIVDRFNSRPSCEGRHRLGAQPTGNLVSIHAPRARGDDRRRTSRRRG